MSKSINIVNLIEISTRSLSYADHALPTKHINIKHLSKISHIHYIY